MQCPTCKVEIKQPGTIQCPECNAFLPELPEQEKTADHASGLTETPDLFSTFLDEIAIDVGQILASDEQDSGKTESETENDAKPVAADQEELIELTDVIETEIDEFDKHIEATGDIESGDHAETFQTAIEVPDEVIELTDPVEPEDVIQAVTEKELDIEMAFIAESEEEMQEVEAVEPELELESFAETEKEIREIAKKKPDIEIESIVDSEDEIHEVEDIELDLELELSVEPVSEVYGEDAIITEQPEDDVEPVAVQKTLFPEDDEDMEIILEEDMEIIFDEDIGIISEEDIEPTKAPEMEVEEEAIIESPKKPKRSSKVIPALVGAAVLIVAVALSGRVFLQKQLKPTPSQTKSPKIVASTKNATPKQTMKKEVKKVAAEEKRLTVQKTHIEKKGNEQPKLDTRKETAVEREALAATEESRPLSIEGAKETVGQQALQTESQKDEKQKTDSEKAVPLVVAQKKLSPPEDEKETATTTIAATPPASGDTSPTDVAKIAPFYTIQVGSYKNKAVVDAMLAALQPKVYLAYIIPKKYEKGFVRYKLRIGKYKTKEEAQKAAESYFDQKQTSYIIVRSEVKI